MGDLEIFVKTFGGFDLYVDGKLIYFSNSKAKEFFAYLIDRKGNWVTLSQLAEVLFDSEQDSDQAKKRVHTTFRRLKKTLAANCVCVDELIMRKRGAYAVKTERISCDSYDLEKLQSSIMNLFLGEYMPEYSWAEMTLSVLLESYQKQLEQSAQ